MKTKQNEIYNLIKQGRFAEAFGRVRAQINSEQGAGYTDKLDELETLYRSFINYFLQNIEEQHQAEMQKYIKQHLLEIADAVCYDQESKNSNREYYNRMRLHTGIDDKSIAHLISAFKDNYNERRVADRFMQDLFYALWAKKSLNHDEKQVLLDSSIDDYMLSIIISALMMGLEEWWDKEKVKIVLEWLTRPNLSPMVKARLWTALVFAIRQYPLHFEVYNDELSPIIQTVFDVNAQAAEELQAVISRLYAALETAEVNKKVQTEVIDGLRHITPDLSRNLDQFTDLSSEPGAKPDWFKALDGTGIDNTLKELSEMQDRGADVMYSTFKGLKHNFFFSEMPNWFLPFDMQHSQVKSVVSSPEFSEIVEVLSSQLCNVDSYALLSTLALMPENIRMQALNQMGGGQIADLREQMKTQEVKSEYDLYLRELKRYLEDLYRFYKDYRVAEEFQDQFDIPYNLDIKEPQKIRDVLKNMDFRQKIADMLLMQKRFVEAEKLLRELCDAFPDDPKIAERRGWTLQLAGKYNEALMCYNHADLIAGETYWVIRQQAECLHRLGRYDEALVAYERCVELKPENHSLLLRMGSCNMAMKRWTEALNCYYRYEFTVHESIQTSRPIAWCLFMSTSYDRAYAIYINNFERYKNEMRAPDFLNAGHAALMLGKRQEAVGYYKESKKRYIHDEPSRGESDFYMALADDFHTMLMMGANYSLLRSTTEAIRLDI